MTNNSDNRERPAPGVSTNIVALEGLVQRDPAWENLRRNVKPRVDWTRIREAERAAYDRDRHANPHRYVDEAVGPLYIENVAHLLAVNRDFVRRISRLELPASRVGQRLVYARADVDRYILSRRDAGQARYVPDRSPRKPIVKSTISVDGASTLILPWDPVKARRAFRTKGPVNDQGKE
jgi:hypothetical protein